MGKRKKRDNILRPKKKKIKISKSQFCRWEFKPGHRAHLRTMLRARQEQTGSRTKPLGILTFNQASKEIKEEEGES